jgi:hypothetical protein
MRVQIRIENGENFNAIYEDSLDGFLKKIAKMPLYNN